MNTHICVTERVYGWHKVGAQIVTEKRKKKKKKVLKETEKKKRNTQKDESGRKSRTEIFT